MEMIVRVGLRALLVLLLEVSAFEEEAESAAGGFFAVAPIRHRLLCSLEEAVDGPSEEVYPPHCLL